MKTTSKQLFGRTWQLTKSKEIALEITEMMFGKETANKTLKEFEKTFSLSKKRSFSKKK